MAANHNNNHNNNNNNNAPAAGRAGVTEHVEFSVQADEDLFLVGEEHSLRRVTADTNYSCLMLKTQRFSSLFRHYAKYHGLRKDELEYYFANVLENEDTPESVQLQRGDTIMVRKRRPAERPKVTANDGEFFKDMRDLLHDEEHMDVVFVLASSNDNNENDNNDNEKDATDTSNNNNNNNNNIGTTRHRQPPQSPQPARYKARRAATVKFEDGIHIHNGSPMSYEEVDKSTPLRAHRAILTARSDYFQALFRVRPEGTFGDPRRSNTTANDSKDVTMDDNNNSISSNNSSSNNNNSSTNTIAVDPIFSRRHVQAVLEWCYTHRIGGVRTLSTDDLLLVWALADQWLLPNLGVAVQHALALGHVAADTVARLYEACDRYGGSVRNNNNNNTSRHTATVLHDACLRYIRTHIRRLTQHTPSFVQALTDQPRLCMCVFQATADLVPPTAWRMASQHRRQQRRQRSSKQTSKSSVSSSRRLSSSFSTTAKTQPHTATATTTTQSHTRWNRSASSGSSSSSNASTEHRHGKTKRRRYDSFLAKALKAQVMAAQNDNHSHNNNHNNNENNENEDADAGTLAVPDSDGSAPV